MFDFLLFFDLQTRDRHGSKVPFATPLPTTKIEMKNRIILATAVRLTNFMDPMHPVEPAWDFFRIDFFFCLKKRIFKICVCVSVTFFVLCTHISSHKKSSQLFHV